jgi:hypothetical protein
MDKDQLTQERLARQAIEEERNARKITYLSELQKKVLIDVSKGVYNNNGIKHETPEASALESLAVLGLVKLVCTKDGDSGRITEKGMLLLHENPKLRFISNDQKWKTMLVLQILTIMITLAGVIVSIVLGLR